MRVEPHDGVSALIKGPHKSPSLLPPCQDTAGRYHGQAENQAFTRHWLCQQLDLGLPACRAMRSNCAPFQPPGWRSATSGHVDGGRYSLCPACPPSCSRVPGPCMWCDLRATLPPRMWNIPRISASLPSLHLLPSQACPPELRGRGARDPLMSRLSLPSHH